mgnify:CR=1 FL=1
MNNLFNDDITKSIAATVQNVLEGKPAVKKEAEEFKPHMMYDPKTGKGYKAEKPEDHERMAKLVLTGEWDTKGISEPAILNPMRAETVREEDAEFTDLFGKWKKDSLTDDEMKAFREKIRQNIILQDLRMLDICDTNLLRYDGKAGAGTLGEAQISALKNQQIFLWVTDGMKISNVSPWLLPAVTKICIDDEIWELLKHFK